MTIPPALVPIELRKLDPDEMTVDGLKEQLDNIGLTCPDADPDKLEQYIKEVRQDLYKGRVQTFDILHIPNSVRSRGDLRVPYESYNWRDYVTAADGNWTDEGSFPGRAKLMFIIYEEHFDWLVENRKEFPGIKNVPPPQEGDNATVDIIKEQFVRISVVASSVVVEGIDQTDIEAVMSNAIAPLNDSNLDDYDVTDSRHIFLSKNYDPDDKTCEGVGILCVWWRLFIKDFRKKSKNSPDHRYRLEVRAWSALYNDLDELDADYEAAKDHFPRAAAELGL